MRSYIYIILLLVFSGYQTLGQCTNGSAYLSANAPTSGTTQISGCTFFGEYNTLNNCVAGTSYTSSCNPVGCITVHQGTPGGPVVAWGTSPLTWTAPASGTYYIHYNTNCSCGTLATCVSTYIQYNGSGGGGGGSGPCASTTSIIGCGTSQSSTLTGTGSWNTTGCGFNTPGVESIWEFTPTTSGIHALNISSISGGFIDFFWMDAASGCGSSGWNCIGDAFTPGTYGSMNWIAGNTYYILIEPESTGTSSVTFSVDCPNPTGYPTGDCAGAIPICSDANFAVDPNGYGSINELCTYCTSNPGTNVNGVNMGCLLSGELNSTWMTITVAQGGTLQFSFGTPGAGYCFDWAMWSYNSNTCSNIYNNTQAPVSCNWNTWCDGFTGISSVPPPGGLAEEFQPTMNVTTGQQFVIMLSNYSSAYTNVPLNFFGTADISCTPLPVEMIGFRGENLGNSNLLYWSTSSEMFNSHFEIEKSVDGENFENIGQVEGVGNSLQVNDYYFADKEVTVAVNYYRLKQVDLDGNFKYSEVITIERKAEHSFKLIATYPNPATDQFNVDFFLDQNDEVEIVLTHSSGREVFSSNETFSRGENHLVIPLSNFAKGMYILSINNVRTQTKQTVKLAIE